MTLLIVKLIIYKIKVSFIVWKAINSVALKYLVIEINCLQYCLNAFYYDVDDLKKGTILWFVVHWDLYPVCRKNDNTFTFKRMLGYNTAFFNDIVNKWQFGRENVLSTTCYIKYSKNHYTYIQSLSSHEKEDFFETENDQCIISRSNVYSSPNILGGTYKNIIPLYSLVMSKNHSKDELVATDKTKKRISDEHSFLSKLSYSSKLQRK